MNLQAPFFLTSTAALDNTFFESTKVFVTSCNADGAIGFVVNRPFGASLHELEEFRHCRPFPLYEGGPVDGEHLFFLHQRPDVIEGAEPVGNGIYFGGDFQQAVAGIGDQHFTASDIKIFVGYCGWDAGELEAEIAEGSWLIAEGKWETVFSNIR